MGMESTKNNVENDVGFRGYKFSTFDCKLTEKAVSYLSELLDNENNMPMHSTHKRNAKHKMQRQVSPKEW